MPVGVEVVVEDGVAAIEFVDSSLRGVGLAALFEHAPADQVAKVTRPAVRYFVPVEYARAAGLLDEAVPAATVAADEPETETKPVKGYDDGFPDMDWSRKAIDDYAAALAEPVGPLDTTGLPKKQDAIDAIKAAVAAADSAE